MDPGEPRFDVIVCGSLHLDIVLHAPNLPRPDETVTGTRWEQKCGGKGGNQAVMAARVGARVAMIGCIGFDDFGTRLRTNLVSEGVDAGAVSVDPDARSGMSVAVVRPDGEYGAVIVSGSNWRIDPEGINKQWKALCGARAVILQNEVPEAVNVAAARAARSDGALVILNAAPARPMSADLLDRVDLLVVNRFEAEMLAGKTVSNNDEAFAAMSELYKAGRDVVITLGAGGLVVQSAAGGKPSWIAPHTVDVVSTHGAGDCLVGALAARLAWGETIIEAAKFANFAAASYVAGKGVAWAQPA
jgi:ribokinase